MRRLALLRLGLVQKHKTSLGIPRWPVDEGMGVALCINLEEPIRALAFPHAVLTETRWETSEWVTIIEPNPDRHITQAVLVNDEPSAIFAGDIHFLYIL